MNEPASDRIGFPVDGAQSDAGGVSRRDYVASAVNLGVGQRKRHTIGVGLP